MCAVQVAECVGACYAAMKNKHTSLEVGCCCNEYLKMCGGFGTHQWAEKHGGESPSLPEKPVNHRNLSFRGRRRPGLGRKGGVRIWEVEEGKAPGMGWLEGQ